MKIKTQCFALFIVGLLLVAIGSIGVYSSVSAAADCESYVPSPECVGPAQTTTVPPLPTTTIPTELASTGISGSNMALVILVAMFFTFSGTMIWILAKHDKP